MWRNQVGQTVEYGPGEARWVRYGLGAGSADLVGILSPHGRLVALEVKSATGRVRPNQELWAGMVRKFGGFVATVRSVDEARAALDRARKGESQ
jgi:hypothetical protein